MHAGAGPLLKTSEEAEVSLTTTRGHWSPGWELKKMALNDFYKAAVTIKVYKEIGRPEWGPYGKFTCFLACMRMRACMHICM